MKRINIFRPGKHTSAGGVTLDFTEDHLKQAVAAYDPELHEAPIVVGHPQDNHPAYGLIGKMEYTEESGVDAIPEQVDPAFSELVTSGRFKKVSASWYTPDSPANPKPGSYYLRHVGFLGAQPPAIKGLKAVAFNEAEEGVVEFSDAWDTQNTAGIFRRLREFIIDKFSKEEADNIIPDYAITDLENSARRQFEDPEASDAEVAYNEAPPQPDEENPMELEQLKAENATLKTQLEELTSKVESFSEREQAIAQREAEIKHSKLVEFVEGAIKAGKVAPAEKDNLIAFMESLDDSKTVDFSEGDNKQQINALEAFQKLISGQPPKVEFGERTAADHQEQDLTPEVLSDRAVAYRKAQAEKGKSISFTEAVAAVESGLDQ